MRSRTVWALKGLRMFSSFASFAKFAILIAIAFIFVLAALSFANSVWDRVRSSSVVRVAKFPDLASPDKDRAPYLLTRAKELAKRVPLDALYEVKVPPLTTRFGLKDDLKFLDEVKINIQGVNVPEVIKNLFAAIPDDQPIVSASPEPAASGSAARLEWKEPSGETYGWLLASNLEPSKPDATRQIIDQAIYTMVYHMHYDPASRSSPPKGVEFPNTRALEAYYSGQQHLSLYQRKRQVAELDEAEAQFRALYQEMPNFTDGLMLLGVTLMEKKNEPEAIVIFERVKQKLREKGFDNLGSDERKAYCSAILFHATALRKLYRLEDNHAALREIEEISGVVSALHQPPAAGGATETPQQKADRLDFLKMHISLVAEKAYVLGAYLILLNDVNFVDELKTNPPAPVGVPPSRRKNPPEAVALPAARTAALATIAAAIQAGGDAATQAKKDHRAVYQAAMKQIYDAHVAAVNEATALIDAEHSKEDSWLRARERFLSELDNAAAYSQYRYAQAVEDDDDAFREQCRQALARLNEAYAVHQNEQTILLNLGLISADPRCDPLGRNIEGARKYLKEASALKPNDYYAHQLLATLGIRQFYVYGPELTKPDILNDAVTAADTARTLRPEGGTIFALLAQAYILQWAQDSSKRAQLKPLIEASILQAARRGATPIHVHTARLQWLLNQAANASDADYTKDLKPKLAAEIDDAISVSTENRTWYGRQLLSDATALKTIVNRTDAGKQSSLRWPG